MATETQGGVEDEGKPRVAYHIYLVAFPTSTENLDKHRAAAPVHDMIHHLVPEAAVFEHDIFVEEAYSPLAQYPDDNANLEKGKEDLKRKNVNSEPTDEQAPSNAKEDPVLPGKPSPLKESSNVEHSDLSKSEQDVDMTLDTASVASLATPMFSPTWVETKALALLDVIQHNIAMHDCNILLSGYGFGGFVVKQAVIIANTTPKYYNIAFKISRLVFFVTPHRIINRLEWGEVLLDMVRTEARYRGGLSQILSGLVDSVSRLSYLFYRFVSKYPIVNFYERTELQVRDPIIGELGIFNIEGEEESVQWDGDYNTIMYCYQNDFEKLATIRRYFALSNIATREIAEKTFDQISESPTTDDDYFKALQALYPSRRVVYEARALDKPDDFIELKQIYTPVFGSMRLDSTRTIGSIQVFGPAGHAKSALVKLVSQEIRQTSSVILIDNFLDQYHQGHPPTLYGIYVSFIHQTLSQRPSLFRPVRKLLSEIMSQRSWTTENLHAILRAILRHGHRLHFLITIYDFELWPEEIQSWWYKSLGELLISCGSVVTFLSSSRGLIGDLLPPEPRTINSEKKYRRFKKALIRARLNSFLDHEYGSVAFGSRISHQLRREIESRAFSFKGPLTSIGTYLESLFHSVIVHTPEAIQLQLTKTPSKEQDLYAKEIRQLQERSIEAYQWASVVVSWILSSMRPLRIEELAVAAAISLDHQALEELQPRISVDIYRDIRDQLGYIVFLEHRYARVISASAKNLFSTDANTSVINHSTITRLCLHYLQLILNFEDDDSEIWNKCLTQVSWKYRAGTSGDQVLDFLDYTCRFWPTHFLLVENPEKSLKDAVTRFLQTPKIVTRWFHLYQLCTSMPQILLEDIWEDEMLVACSEFIPGAPKMPPKGSINLSRGSPDVRKLAASIPAYVGLDVAIPDILNIPAEEVSIKKMDLRRGYAERTAVFLGTEHSSYLDCVISNDDDCTITELIKEHREKIIEESPLHKAALSGCVKTVKTLFRLLDTPGQVDAGGRTPLHMAAIGGHEKVIEFFLSSDGVAKAPNMINTKDNSSQTPLILACRMGNTEAANELIESPTTDLGIKDNAGKAAIHYAVFNCPGVVEGLIGKPEQFRLRDKEDITPLHVATICGNREVVSIIISTKSSSTDFGDVINAQDSRGKTPLHYAAEFGWRDTVQILIDNGADFSIKDNKERIPVELAATKGHVSSLRTISDSSTDVPWGRILEAACGAGQLIVVHYVLSNKLTSPNGDGSRYSRPLSRAISKGHNETVHVLLGYGAEVNVEDRGTQFTPLHHAVVNSNYDIALRLLDMGADANSPDISRETPLHLAADRGLVNIIKLLLENKANVKAISETSTTALHLAVKSPECVNVLLEAEADPNACDFLGRTPLHAAAMGSCHSTIPLLLKEGADIEAEDDEGRPAVYYAIERNSLQTVTVLCRGQVELRDSEERMRQVLEWAIESYGNSGDISVLCFLLEFSSKGINTKGSRGESLLHVAAATATPEVLKLLIKYGEKVNSKDSSEETPLWLATKSSRVENMRELVEQGADVNKRNDVGETPLHFVSRSGNVDAIGVLLNAGADVNAVDRSSNRTPLYRAAFSGRTEAVEKLLVHGADVHIVENSDGWSPLHAGVDNLAVTKLLLTKGADSNLRKYDQWTPLHLAVYWNKLGVVEELLAAGRADPNMKNDYDRNSLHIAVSEDSPEIAEVLLKYKADPNLKDKRGMTPLHTAISHSSRLVNLLLDNGGDYKIRTDGGDSCLSLVVAENGRQDNVKILEILLEKMAWPFADMVKLYWNAINNLRAVGILETLVQKEPSLWNEISSEGYTGLEACLRKGRDDEDAEMAIFILNKLGIDPLQRPRTDAESYFELGIISRRKLRLKFLDLCVQAIFDTKKLEPTPGFKELRILTELDNPEIWRKLEALRSAASSTTDQDGWNLEHFIRQAGNRVPLEPDKELLSNRTKTPTSLVMPPMWQRPDVKTDSLFEIKDGGRDVSFKPFRDSHSRLCLRADFPFPPRDQGVSYFEMVVLPPDPSNEEQDADGLTVAIGLCGEFCDQSLSHPGWNVWSVGYHGDDESIYQESSEIGHSIGREFGIGSTVGCGIDFNAGEYFFTVDGSVVDRRRSKIVFRKMYPAISHNGNACNVKVNFDGDFKWSGAEKGDMEPPPRPRRTPTWRDSSRDRRVIRDTLRTLT